jgi:hypothetical protein
MAVFAVSFRIADENSTLGSYSERWSSVNDAIQSKAVGRHYWKQTTSFFALESQETTSAALASAIDNGSKFDRTKDTLLVINLSARAHTLLGVNSDSDLDAIMGKR